MSVTIDQRMGALKRANEARRAKRLLKEDLAALDYSSGPQEIARLLREDPDRIASVPVHCLLEATPGFGASKVRRLLTSHDPTIWPLKPCRELSDRQRLWLAGQLERMAASGRRRVR